MSTCHFIARLNAAFYSEINFSNLQNAWCQIITLLQFRAFFITTFFVIFAQLLNSILCCFKFLIGFIVLNADLKPIFMAQFFQILQRDFIARFESSRTTLSYLTHKHFFNTLINVRFTDPEFVFQVLFNTLKFCFFNL